MLNDTNSDMKKRGAVFSWPPVQLIIQQLFNLLGFSQENPHSRGLIEHATQAMTQNPTLIYYAND